MKDFYDILGVDSECDFASLKRAFYAAAKRCHPDRFGNAPEKTHAFQELVEAFDVLSDPLRRREYDVSKLDTLARMAAESCPETPGAIMDTEGADVLEELIVGNRTPPETSLMTLLADLTKTDVFVAYRVGKTAAARGDFRAAARSLQYAVACAPENIVFRVHLARALAAQRGFRRARYHYRCALAIGENRTPRQELIRVRFELAEMNRAARPWLWRVLGIGGDGPKRPTWSADAAEEMLAELSRSMSRAARRELKNGDGARRRIGPSSR